MNTKRSGFFECAIVTLVLVALCSLTGPLFGQMTTPVRTTEDRGQFTGLPQDWTHRHLVFSNPGTEEEAIRKGTYDRWLTSVNEPRFLMQQWKQKLVPERAVGDAIWQADAAGSETPVVPVSLRVKKPVSKIDKDWSMDLGSGGHLAVNQYPAKYSFSTSAASCSDFVVYPTGLGGSSTQATVVAYNNLYATTCTTATGPSMNWAYNTGSGAVTTSPVLSIDGKQVAYVQVASSKASLVLVKLAQAPAGGTLTATWTTTSKSITVSSSTPLNPSDVGALVSGTGIPAGTTIASVTSTTAGTLSATPTAAGTNATLTLNALTASWSTSSTSFTVSSSTPLNANDVGVQVSGTGIPAATTIASVTSATTGTLSATPTAAGTNATLTFVAETAAEPGVPPTAASASAYRSCTAPCMYSIAFTGTPNDTNSAPFYVYSGGTGGDTIYVGDNSGKVHSFSGVFSGSPAEVVGSGWPITVSSNVLTGPVYDPTSGNIFVADSGGYLYSYKASTAAHEMTSSKLTNASGTVGIVDAPLVDSSAGYVYVFVGDDANTYTAGGDNFECSSTTGCSGVFQFATSNTTVGSGACAVTSATSWGSGTNCGQEVVFGIGTTTTPTIYDGAFDRNYMVGTGTSGNLWVCAAMASAEPRLGYVTMQSNGGIVPTSGNVIAIGTTAISTLASGTASCSPVTEIFGSDGTTNDYVFLSVTASGNQSACTGACLYNFIVGTGGSATTAGTESTPSSATAGIAATGGTSGIIIDNVATATGESQIYYTPLSNMSCTGNGSTGSGTGGCAVQASQTAP